MLENHLYSTSLQRFARVLVEYSTDVHSGDEVAIVSSTAAEPLLQLLYTEVLDLGGHPNLLLNIADQEELFFRHASPLQLDWTPVLHQIVFEQFDVLIKVRAETNTRALSKIDPGLQARRQKAMAPTLAAQLRRGAEGSLRWVSTLFPTPAMAMEAEMGYLEYQEFVYRACHVYGEADPVVYWQKVKIEQEKIVGHFEGRDQVHLQGPNVDLSLSIKGRKFINGCGQHNMPDGEIYTGPVEDSANGWVRFTYPAVYNGRVVEGVELTFKDGKVVNARADKHEDFLIQMLNTDVGARYLGEFAIGTNHEINRSTHNILLDEKIGGSFHLALGAGYPETGAFNKSVIHWDMICDIKIDSEIVLDGEVIYQNGAFVS
jgi:aminopeptidase